jgi:tetratricopeptide (TPR) repeat protein
MAYTKTSFDYLDDMFSTMASQEAQRAQAANTALSSGLEFYQKKDFSRAAGEFKRAIAMDPTNVQSYNYLANSYLADKKPEEAIKAYKNSLALDPYQDTIRVNLGNVYLQQKKHSLAEKEYKEASRVNPSNTVAPYTLGQLYVQTERFAEAETQFKKVQKMVPYDANPYFSLGLVYNKQKKYGEAVKQLTEAVRLKPKMAPAHLELGIAYAALGDDANAQKEVQILTQLDANQGALLKRSISRPKMLAGSGGPNDNFFPILQTPSTTVLDKDPYLLSLLSVADLDQPSASKEFSLTFFFDSDMDANSVQDVNNWTISKATGGVAGYYRNMMPIPNTEAYIQQNPTSVAYDPQERSATITFTLSQDASKTATIDSAHTVFKFSGKDVTGKMIDPNSDEWAYAAQMPF